MNEYFSFREINQPLDELIEGVGCPPRVKAGEQRERPGNPNVFLRLALSGDLELGKTPHVAKVQG